MIGLTEHALAILDDPTHADAPIDDVVSTGAAAAASVPAASPAAEDADASSAEGGADAGDGENQAAVRVEAYPVLPGILVGDMKDETDPANKEFLSFLADIDAPSHKAVDGYKMQDSDRKFVKDAWQQRSARTANTQIGKDFINGLYFWGVGKSFLDRRVSVPQIKGELVRIKRGWHLEGLDGLLSHVHSLTYENNVNRFQTLIRSFLNCFSQLAGDGGSANFVFFERTALDRLG